VSNHATKHQICFCQPWASSARTGLTGMGDRSDRSSPSWSGWAPQHLNLSLSLPHQNPCPQRPALSLPSSLLPKPSLLNPSPQIHSKARGASNRSQESSPPRSPPWGDVGLQVLRREGVIQGKLEIWIDLLF